MTSFRSLQPLRIKLALSAACSCFALAGQATWKFTTEYPHRQTCNALWISDDLPRLSENPQMQYQAKTNEARTAELNRFVLGEKRFPSVGKFSDPLEQKLARWWCAYKTRNRDTWHEVLLPEAARILIQGCAPDRVPPGLLMVAASDNA